MEKSTSPGRNHLKKKKTLSSSTTESTKQKKLKRLPPAIENNNQIYGNISNTGKQNKVEPPSVVVKDNATGHSNDNRPRGDGLCRSCMEELLDETIPRAAEDVVKKMQKPVCKEEKLMRKFKATRLAQLSALEKHADFLKTNARIIFRNTIDAIVEDSCNDDA